MESDFGVLVPPVALHAVAPDTLAAAWMLLRETLIVSGNTVRAAKETVATAVSFGNACPYCATIHNSSLTAFGVAGRGAETDDLTLAALAEWVQSAAQPDAGSGPPVPTAQLPELVGVAVLLHYLNRMANAFLREVPLPPGVPDLALSPVLRILGRLMRAASLRQHGPGESLDLLPQGESAADLAWTAGSRTVAEAFARAGTAIDAAGSRSVPDDVRDLVRRRLVGWRGRLRGISRAWVEDLVGVLPNEQHAAGRLTLLVAFASYQIDDSVVARCREAGADDAMLVEMCSWAAMAAARRIGSVLAAPGGDAR
jgi:AhpD family alkylhydroperoxidase